MGGSAGGSSQPTGSNGHSAGGLGEQLRAEATAEGYDLKEISAGDVEAFRKKNDITVSPDCPDPMLSFDPSMIEPGVMAIIKQSGFTAPSPIQAQSWPASLQGRDIIGVAKTGSGKTLAFLMPAFKMIRNANMDPRYGCAVLVLAPTRELANQIQDECRKFASGAGIRSTCVFGGAPKGMQLGDINRGVHIIIATPGRLNDFLEMRQVNLRQVRYLVFDEADRMLDMGFEPQIRKILMHVPPQRQTLFFTATWPKEVRQLAHDFMSKPIQINIGNSDELNANRDITQVIHIIEDMRQKNAMLMDIIRQEQQKFGGGCRILVFCSTKKMCDQLAYQLHHQVPCGAIHGDKDQRTRDRVLMDFKTGRSPVMIATDVAARGLDIKEVMAVINFDFASNTEDYVHRIGRTGRAGKKGTAYTFFSQKDGGQARKLITVLERAGQQVPDQLRQIAMNSRGGGKGGKGGMRFSSGGYGGGGYGGGGYGGGYGGMPGSGSNNIPLGNRPGMPSAQGSGFGGQSSGFGGQASYGAQPQSAYGARGKSRSPRRSRSPSDRGRSRDRSRSRDRRRDRRRRDEEDEHERDRSRSRSRDHRRRRRRERREHSDDEKADRYDGGSRDDDRYDGGSRDDDRYDGA